MTPRARPSPNHDTRGGAPIDILVLHYTGMRTAQEALSRLCDSAAKVSAHYTIDRDGTVYAHVPEELRAWHAGVSFWAGERNVNARSIGIELVNPGHAFGYIPFAEDQIAALIDLAHGIFARHGIPAKRVVGHSDVAPSRKQDPGELFPWARLAEFGIGVWPSSGASRHPPRERGRISESASYPPPFTGEVDRRVGAETEGDFRAALIGYGYDPEVPLQDAVAAFQRHFRPSCIDGIADSECASLLNGLLAL